MWSRFNSQMKVTLPYKLTQTDLELQDLLLDLDQLTVMKDKTVFELEPMAPRPWGFDQNVLQNISIEMNLDLKYLSRDGYTVLDLLSDIGGIQGLLFSFAAIFVGFINYNQVENHLVKKLFVRKDAKGSYEMGPDIQTSRFRETCCQNLAEYFQENCLSTCCGKGKRDRAFAKARDELNRETSIIELIR